jgi:hypothetical protein
MLKKVSRSQSILSTILLEPPHPLYPNISEAPMSPNTKRRDAHFRISPAEEYPPAGLRIAVSPVSG